MTWIAGAPPAPASFTICVQGPSDPTTAGAGQITITGSPAGQAKGCLRPPRE